MAEWFIVNIAAKEIQEQPSKRYATYALDNSAKVRREKAGIYFVERNRYELFLIHGFKNLHDKLKELGFTTKDFKFESGNVVNHYK